MPNQLSTNYVQILFLGALMLLVIIGLISSGKKRRKEELDPSFVYGSIREMYVCYQCDTIFNTLRCPVCNEEAVIPLVQLTGSIMENERLAAVIGKLQRCNSLQSPSGQTFLDRQDVLPVVARRPEFSNGSVSEVC